MLHPTSKTSDFFTANFCFFSYSIDFITAVYATHEVNIMEINFMEMIVRTTFSFFAILFLARLIGKKQLSQLTFFHYITGITIGSIASEISAQAETPFWDGLISLIWWSALTIIVSILSLKSKKLRTIFDDKPTMIIEEGKILMHNLKKTRLNLDELSMLLREQNVFNFQEIQHAIFETNGQLSVIKFPQFEAANKQDVKAAAPPITNIPTEVIEQGRIIYENLYALGLDDQWLMKKLRRQNIEQVTDVDFAQVLDNGSLYVSSHTANRSS